MIPFFLRKYPKAVGITPTLAKNSSGGAAFFVKEK